MKKLVLPLLSSLLFACGDNVDTTGPDPEDPPPDAPPVVEPPPPGLGIQFFDFPIAIDVSADGRIAVFEELTIDAAIVHFHDTLTGETIPMVELGSPGRTMASGVSNTGAISALHGEPVQAGRWTEATDWTDLGSPHATGCDADLSGAFDISADGNVVVGLAWNQCTPTAARWTADGGITPLQVIGTASEGSTNPPGNRASVVSDNGQIAAGFAEHGPLDRSPAVWNADGTGFLLDPSNVDAPGEVLSISGDGRTVAGQTGNDGFLWTPGTGIVLLPRLPNVLPFEPMFPNAMTDDGTRIFGGLGSAFFSIPTAFVWSFDEGTRPLADLVIAAGIALPEGLTLNSVTGASADGTVLVGTATDVDFNLKTFVVRLRY